MESMVNLLHKLEKSVEKNSSTTKGTTKTTVGTLVLGNGVAKQENKTWIGLKESELVQSTSPQQLNSNKDLIENRFPKLSEAIQREKVSIGKALDGSRFKKVQRLNKTPQNMPLKNGLDKKTSEEGVVTPNQVIRTPE